MKMNPLRGFSALLMFNLALMLSGCATPGKHSFNQDFNQNLTTAPQYYIEDQGPSRFKVTVEQGHQSTGQERVIDAKRAASAVTEMECKRRGWRNWQMDYIYEKNQGWMHVVKAEVVPKNAVEYGGGTHP